MNDWNPPVVINRGVALPPTPINLFASGVTSMAQNCLPAIELVRHGKWTLDDVERWLKAVIEGDAEYLNKVTPQLVAKVA